MMAWLIGQGWVWCWYSCFAHLCREEAFLIEGERLWILPNIPELSFLLVGPDAT